MADPIELLPMNFGQYGGLVTYESNATRDGAGEIAVPAAWPPMDSINVSIGATQAFADDSASHEAQGDQMDENGDWVESPAFPDGYEMLPGTYRRSVGAFTFDVSEVDVAATDNLRLRIDFNMGGGAWLFGIDEDFLAVPGNPNYVASSGDITSTNQTVLLDWIGGSFDDLTDFADILRAKADQYPFDGSAATVDLMAIATDPYGGSPGAQDPITDIPLSNWQDLFAESDWVTLVGSFADRPDVFWGWQDFINARQDSTLYTMRNWIGFDSAAFLTAGNPVFGVSLNVIPAAPEQPDDPRRRPAITLAADVPLAILGGGLSLSGRAVNPVPRPILSHQARRRRGW